MIAGLLLLFHKDLLVPENVLPAKVLDLNYLEYKYLRLILLVLSPGKTSL